LVIKIDEEDYKIMKHNIEVNNPLCPLSQEEMVSKVVNGVPLPKGHGRLIDADKLIESILCKTFGLRSIDIENAPTIVENEV
jgi:hypothetical protein